MKNIIFLIILLVSISMLISFPVRITSWEIREDVKKLNNLNFSIDYVNADTQTIIVYVPNEIELNRLIASGFDAEPMPDLAKQYADALEQETMHSSDPLRAYYTYTEYITFMQNTAAQYPTLCQLVQFGTTVQDRPLYFMKISDNVTIQENEPEFRYVSSMHGDEVVGYDLMIRLINLLVTQYNTDPRTTEIVNNTEVWICPMLNPDGYVAHSRYNANGSDLNRNFPLPVGSEHPDGMATQPETSAVMNHGDQHSFNLSANFHGGALVANYPWDYIYPLTPDNNLFVQLALSYSIHNTAMYNSTEFDQGITNGADWYIAPGTLQDWVYAFNGCFDITIEVSNIKWPSSSTLDSYWAQNQESILTFLEFARKGVYGTVTNAQGQPLNATIDIDASGIDIKTDPDVGDYHRILLPGNYNLAVYADGYQSASANVVVTEGNAVVQNFVLQPVVMTSFTGTVINTSGEVISNAQVTLVSGPAVLQTSTDTMGAFSFTSIPAGSYNLSVTASGSGCFNRVYSLSADNNKQIIVLSPPLVYDNFSNGLGIWTAQSPWSVYNLNGNPVLTDSPSGNYANNLSLSARLTNPISLSGVSNPMLTFDLKYALENGYDYLYVEISENNSNWTNLATFTGSISNMQNYSYALSAYTWQNLYLRFRLSTDSAVNADGVYIDNVLISGFASDQTVYGDTDSNWMINLTDMYNILEYSVGNDPIPALDPYPWSAFRVEAADVDNDNVITATDAYYIYDRFRAYTSSFPVQAGNIVSFQNPGLQITVCCGAADAAVASPANLKALTLAFSSVNNMQFINVSLNQSSQNVLLAFNLANNRFSVLCLDGADLPSGHIVYITYQNLSEYTHCLGLVNDLPIDLNIQTTDDSDHIDQPVLTRLQGIYPNPFSTNANVSYSVSSDKTFTHLAIYNVKGQLVRTLLSDPVDKGSKVLLFDGKDSSGKPLVNGIYFCRMQTAAYSGTVKMVVFK